MEVSEEHLFGLESFKEEIEKILNERTKKINRTNIDEKIIDKEAIKSIIQEVNKSG